MSLGATIARADRHRTVRAVPDQKVSFSPVALGQVHLELGLGGLCEVAARARTELESARHLAVLARFHGLPLGIFVVELDAGSPRAQWTEAFQKALSGALRGHLHDHDEQTSWSGDPWEPVTVFEPRCQELRRRTLQAAVPVSVVVATHDRPESLERCLDSILASDYPDYEVVVVDNAPSDDSARAVVTSSIKGSTRVRYVREDEQGLAAAHNRGLCEARGGVIAFTDDDVIVDRSWLGELVAPIVEGSATASSGLIFPAELLTASQVHLEAHGRFSKGFSPRRYDLGANRPSDRLFPFTVGRLASGANMAFSARYLRGAGGFDPALGTGTPARGGDDLEGVFHLLSAGHTLAYQPGAIVWHHHRTSEADVATQARGYGVGLGAFLTSVCLTDKRAALRLSSHLVAALAHAWRTTEAPGADGPLRELMASVPAYPRRLVLSQRLGIAAGPLAYLRSRRSHRRRHLAKAS